jgi:hypothetical protein
MHSTRTTAVKHYHAHAWLVAQLRAFDAKEAI